MAYSIEQFVEEVSVLIQSVGGRPRLVYVGITDDLKRRFTEHGLLSTDRVSCFDAGSLKKAQLIENYFVNGIGTDGGPGGETEESRFVYAYLKRRHTNP